MKIFSLQSKIFFVIAMLVLSVVGCQKDDDLKELDLQKELSLSNFRVQRIERNKIDANRKLKEKLNEISSSNKSNFKGIVHSSEYGFSINTDYATYMEDVNGTYHSYTFPVIREGEEGLLENLVLSLRPDGSYRILLMAYDITDQEKEQISNNEYVNLEGKTTIYLLDDATLVTDIFGKKLISTNCVSSEYEIGPCAGGVGDEHESVYNSSIGGMCGGSTSTLVNIDIDAACLDGGGGSDPDNNDPGDNTNTNTDTDTSGNHVETGGVGSGDHTTITCTRNCLDEPCDTTSDEDFNASYSSLSPFNVDLSQVRNKCDNINLVENEKFMCIYNKLASSPKFKRLFLDTFQESPNFNVRFELVDSLPNSTGARAGSDPLNPSIPSSGIHNFLIKINKNKMDPLHEAKAPTIEIARDILHECIHTFLYVKKYNCNNGSTIDELDNMLLGELLNEVYDGTCEPLQEQHELMLWHLIPTMVGILSEVRDNFIPPHHQENVEYIDYGSEMYVNNPFNGSHPFNWDEFYENISIVGLQNTFTFEQQIATDPIKNYLFLAYAGGTNGTVNSFSKTYCSE